MRKVKIITKDDLKYTDYTWNSINKDYSQVSIRQNGMQFNRKEGYEMLYFINSFCEKNSITQKHLATELERIIRELIPQNLCTPNK